MEIKLPIYFTDKVLHNNKTYGIAYLEKTPLLLSTDSTEECLHTLELTISDDNINILKSIVKNFENRKNGLGMLLTIYLYNNKGIDKCYYTYNETYIAIKNKEENINTCQYSEKLISLAIEYGYTVAVYSSPSKVKYLN